jgi:hypothetical protein
MNTRSPPVRNLSLQREGMEEGFRHFSAGRTRGVLHFDFSAGVCYTCGPLARY